MGNWNSLYKGYENSLFPGSRYPHESVIQFVANLNRSSDLDMYLEEETELNKKYSKDYLKENDILNKNALDIGFGTIADLKMLMDFGYKGYGVEVSEHAIQCAKMAVEYFKLPITISKYEPYTLQFPDIFFDLIISNASVYYNIEFEKFLIETHRVLRKGGYFFHKMMAKDHGYLENNYAIHCHSNVFEWVRYPIDELNGIKFVCYEEDDLHNVFGKLFNNVKVSYIKYNYQSLKQSWWIITGNK
jgi:SAM-dependent methyltransferase